MRELTIDVGFDLICPWCWIGKRQLAKAVRALQAQAPDVQIRVEWRGHVLLPQVPDQGWPFREFYEQRLGGPHAVAQRQAQVRAAGDAVGLQFDFDRIQTMPSTRLAHRLVAQTQALYGSEQTAWLIEALFAAYFQQGLDIGQAQVLDALAQGVLTHAVAHSDMRESQGKESSKPDVWPAQGVPHFVINGRVAIEGAVSHEVLLRAMRDALSPAEPLAVPDRRA